MGTQEILNKLKEINKRICCLSSSIAPVLTSTNADYTYTLEEGTLLTHVVVKSLNSITFNIGTTPGGTQIYTDTISDGYEVISIDQYAYGSNLTLYFSGYNPETVTIKIYTQ